MCLSSPLLKNCIGFLRTTNRPGNSQAGFHNADRHRYLEVYQHIYNALKYTGFATLYSIIYVLFRVIQKMSIFTLTYAKLCERTMSTAVHPTLGLHHKALVAEGPQGWILSRAQELPRVRSEPGTSARQSQVSEEHQSSLCESRCKEGKNCCAAADRGRGETPEMQPCRHRGQWGRRAGGAPGMQQQLLATQETHRGAGCPFAPHRHRAELISAHRQPLQEQPQAGAQNIGHLEKLSPTDRTLTHNDKNDFRPIPGSSDNSFHKLPQPLHTSPTGTPKQLLQAAMLLTQPWISLQLARSENQV